MIFNHTEKLQVLEAQLAHQRRYLMSGLKKRTVSQPWAAKQIALWAEIVEDSRRGGGEMSEEQTVRLMELESRVKILEELMGVGGNKLIRMKRGKYVLSPDTDQWRAWHRWFVEMNDPRVYRTGEIEVSSLWPE